MRIYYSNDFKMLIAAKTILLNYNDYLNYLKSINSRWGKNNIIQLIQELNHTLELYHKVSAKKQNISLGHKLTIYKIHAVKAIRHLNNLIIHHTEGTEEYDKILNQLPINTENELTEDTETLQLIEILLLIKQNLNSGIIEQICTNESEKKFINKMLQYTNTIPEIYYSYKSLIAVRKTIMEYAITRYNFIYSSIKDISLSLKNKKFNPIQNSIDYINFIDMSKKENILR